MAGYIHHYDSHLKSVAVLVPTAAEINFHNFFFFGLNKINVLSYSYGSQKFKIYLMGLKSRRR